MTNKPGPRPKGARPLEMLTLKEKILKLQAENAELRKGLAQMRNGLGQAHTGISEVRAKLASLPASVVNDHTGVAANRAVEMHDRKMAGMQKAIRILLGREQSETKDW